MNTFPTAAGLASSAAGYAALVYGLARLFCAKEQYAGQLSAIARQGSGSACRSLYGGLVRCVVRLDEERAVVYRGLLLTLHDELVAAYCTCRWEKGHRTDGEDSRAVQVVDEQHWPELRAMVVVASGAEKETPSTIGMINSVKTSELLR